MYYPQDSNGSEECPNTITNIIMINGYIPTVKICKQINNRFRNFS